jgi:hypothetical protein
MLSKPQGALITAMEQVTVVVQFFQRVPIRLVNDPHEQIAQGEFA